MQWRKNTTYRLNRSSCLIFFNLVNSSSEWSVSEPPILILSPPINSDGLPVGAEYAKGSRFDKDVRLEKDFKKQLRKKNMDYIILVLNSSYFLFCYQNLKPKNLKFNVRNKGTDANFLILIDRIFCIDFLNFLLSHLWIFWKLELISSKCELFFWKINDVQGLFWRFFVLVINKVK